jgi:transposase
MQICSVGIDPGKTTFHLVALGVTGKVLVRKKFTQRQLLTYTANMRTSLIGLEACSLAHFLGRVLRKQGHDVRLIAAQFVKPFVKSNKNDFVDAEAIAEAVERKNMRFVPIKTDEQLDLQTIHRVRDRLISRRTAVINQLRAFLLERGSVFAKTPAKLRAAMSDILENAEVDLTPQMRSLIDLLWGEWKTVEQQIEVLSLELERISATDAGCTPLTFLQAHGGSNLRYFKRIGSPVAAGFDERLMVCPPGYGVEVASGAFPCRKGCRPVAGSGLRNVRS